MNTPPEAGPHSTNSPQSDFEPSAHQSSGSDELTWMQLLRGALFIAAVTFSASEMAPLWLRVGAAIVVGFLCLQSWSLADLKEATRLDELELRIRVEGNALTLRFALIGLLVITPFGLHIRSWQIAFFLGAAGLLGHWWVRRRYR